MLSWASSQFEKLAQTVAPPPTDPVSRFLYCCQRGEEDEAIQLAAQLPGSGVVVNLTKQQVPLHVSCTHGMVQLTRHLLGQPGASLDMLDGAGNTLLHCAAMCAQPVGLDLVKVLVQELGANVCAKNIQGQTPYDVATLNSIRQFLLPIQLQQETKEALANGGQGLPPGLDIGGLKIQNRPPPPIPGSLHPKSPPAQLAPPQETESLSSQAIPPSPYPQPPNPFVKSASTPFSQSGSPYPNPSYPGSGEKGHATKAGQSLGKTTSTIDHTTTSTPLEPKATDKKLTTLEANTPSAGAPISGDKHSYALSGYSSAAIYKPSPGSGGIRPDGFHSSSSDKRLQQKYGHAQSQQYSNLPPPPSSGSSVGALSGGGGTYGNSASAPPSGGPNPYAGGLSHNQRSKRYVNYSPVIGQAPAAVALRPYASYGAPMNAVAPTAQKQSTTLSSAHPTPAPVSAGVSPISMPPPPFQLPQSPAAANDPKTLSKASPSSFPNQPICPSRDPSRPGLMPVSPFAQPSVSSPSSLSMLAPARDGIRGSIESAAAVFSCPAGDTLSTSSGPLLSPPQNSTSCQQIQPEVRSSEAGTPVLHSPPVEKLGPRSSSPLSGFASQDNPVTEVASMLSNTNISASSQSYVAPLSATAPATTFDTNLVTFSKCKVSGVSLISSGSDVADEKAQDSLSSAHHVVKATSTPSPTEKYSEEHCVPPNATPVARACSSENVGVSEEEDFDKLDEIPLSPQGSPTENETGTQSRTSGMMPPPPFSNE